MLKVYNVDVNGYTATGLVDIEGIPREVEVEFQVTDPNGDLYIDLDCVEYWDGLKYHDISEIVDLDELAADIAVKGDINLWAEDEIGSQVDAAMDSLDVDDAMDSLDMER